MDLDGLQFSNEYFKGVNGCNEKGVLDPPLIVLLSNRMDPQLSHFGSLLVYHKAFV